MKKAGVYLLYGVLAVATLTAATLALSARPTPATVNSTTITANGVGMLALWGNADFTLSGYVQLTPVGGKSAAEPSYYMIYGAFSSDLTTNDSGQGFTPASAVSFSGGTILKGNAVIKLNVDTCTLPTTEFQTTSGDCGTVEVTATEVPGFTYTVNGTTTFTIGTTHEVSSGTTQSANALGSGSEIGIEFSPSEIFFIGLSQFSGVSVTISRP